MLGPKATVAILTGLCAGAIACGSTSPVSPSASGFFGARGAVITGRVTGAPLTAVAQSTTTARPLASAATLTVTIVGTDISAAVDGRGNFELTGVPPGDVQLRFTGSGVSASITLSGVSVGDRIHIVVELNGDTARLESEDRDHDDDEDEDEDEDEDDEDDNELEGVVSNRSGTCPSLTFTVQAVTVTTNNATTFEDPCERVVDGRRVEVEGTFQSNGTLLATEVEIED